MTNYRNKKKIFCYTICIFLFYIFRFLYVALKRMKRIEVNVLIILFLQLLKHVRELLDV